MESERDGSAAGFSFGREEPGGLATGELEMSDSRRRPLEELCGGEKPLGDDRAMVGIGRHRGILVWHWLRARGK